MPGVRKESSDDTWKALRQAIRGERGKDSHAQATAFRQFRQLSGLLSDKLLVANIRVLE